MFINNLLHYYRKSHTIDTFAAPLSIYRYTSKPYCVSNIFTFLIYCLLLFSLSRTHTHAHMRTRTVVPHIIAQRQHLRPAQAGEQHVQLSHQQPKPEWTRSRTGPPSVATDTAQSESESNCTAQCTTQQQTAAPTAATSTAAACCRRHLR